MKTIGQIAGGLSASVPAGQESKQEAPRLSALPWLVLPYQAQEDIAAAQKLRQRYMIIGPEEKPLDGCPNCQGLGNLWIRFICGGPYKSPPALQKGETSTWLRDGWYRVLSKFYPCPVCSDPAGRIPFLFERSGLEPAERSWSVDFIKGMPGKEQGLALANCILDQLPKTRGFTCFFGSFGTGKSGLVKSIIAQCVTAGVPAGYFRAADMLRDIRSTFSESAQLTEADVTRQFGDFQVLGIDEIDRVSSTPWSMATLMAILDARYNQRLTRATLLVTNQDPDHLPPGFEYLVSRMRDGDRVQIAGQELRG